MDTTVRRVLVPRGKILEVLPLAEARARDAKRWIRTFDRNPDLRASTIKFLMGLIGEIGLGWIYGFEPYLGNTPSGDGGRDAVSPLGFRIDVKARKVGDRLAMRPVYQQEGAKSDVIVFASLEGHYRPERITDCLLRATNWAFTMDVSAWPIRTFYEGGPDTHWRECGELPTMDDFEEMIWPR